MSWLSKTSQAHEIVLYTYDIKTQSIRFLFRGRQIPQEYREYPPLWRVVDRERQIKTIIISL